MIDVAAVLEGMWDHCLTTAFKNLFTKLHKEDQEARDTLVFWAALHDIGKATRDFSQGVLSIRRV